MEATSQIEVPTTLSLLPSNYRMDNTEHKMEKKFHLISNE